MKRSQHHVLSNWDHITSQIFTVDPNGIPGQSVVPDAALAVPAAHLWRRDGSHGPLAPDGDDAGGDAGGDVFAQRHRCLEEEEPGECRWGVLPSGSVKADSVLKSYGKLGFM